MLQLRNFFGEGSCSLIRLGRICSALMAAHIRQFFE